MIKNSIKMSRPFAFLLGTITWAYASIMISTVAYAAGGETSDSSIFVSDGVAVRGADVVAYFVQGQRVDGSSEYAVEQGGVTWHFSSAENRDLFVADPEKYAPAYGGYCAYALSLGAHKVATDPDAWTIVDGRLYLNKTLRMRTLWQGDISGRIQKADANWATLAAH